MYRNGVRMGLHERTTHFEVRTLYMLITLSIFSPMRERSNVKGEAIIITNPKGLKSLLSE